MNPVQLELTQRDAEVIALMIELFVEELKPRPVLRQSQGISLKDLQNLSKVRKRLTKK